jgi:sulfonate transport system substrate-binding protein
MAALTRGALDAWAIWDPYTAQGQTQAGARILVDGTGYTTGYNLIVAAEKTLEDKARTAALRDYLTRQRRALVWANADVKGWGAVWSRDTGLPLPVAEQAARRRAAKLIKVDDALVRNEQLVADAFRDEKLIPGEVDMTEFVDRRFNDIEVKAK